MIREERLLKVLRAPHVSEKASTAMEKSNTIVLKVAKDATKAEIKAIQCAERFIQQQYARFIHQCSGDSNPLALTTRKL